jgi:glyoxylase-like metal-dependent hydrolase (beta-lactamase superfamily II)
MPALEAPILKSAESVHADWTVLPSWAPVGELGALTINSFVLKGREPMLVDTGIGAFGDGWIEMLESVVDPADLRWIWLSHMDWDHIGNLRAVLARAPGATVITSPIGVAKLGLVDIQPQSVHLIAAGESIEIDDRRIVATKPAYYDAPETMGFFDETARVLFSADSFGALLPAPIDHFTDAEEAVLREGMVTWSAVDSPWLADQLPEALGRKLASIERLEPKVVLSAHLPPAHEAVRTLTGIVARAYGAIAPARSEGRVAELAAALG